MARAIPGYAPAFEIVIAGETLRLGETVDVMSLRLTETVNQPDSFQMTLREHHPDVGRLFAGGDRLRWMDILALDEYSEVEIYLGYVDETTLSLLGEITAVSLNFPASAQPVVTVQGLSLYGRLQRRTCHKPVKSKTDSDVAKEIAAIFKLDADVDPTTSEHPLITTNGKSYAAILLERAERIGYEVAVKDSCLVFKMPGYRSKPMPQMTLEWGRDLISFTPRLSTSKMPTEVTVRGTQTSRGGSKTPLVGTAKAGEERVKLGSQTITEITRSKSIENAVLVSDHNVDSQEEAKEMALAQLETRGMAYITGRGSCIGQPSLVARKVIALKGLGKLFSGNYYVVSTTHTIDSSGYRTDFDVKRNAR